VDKKRILIVDDELLIRLAVEDTLIDTYDIITATNGREALEKVDSHNPDLVIMDVSMPEMDGFEAVKAMRSRRPSQHPAVIFLSARTQRIDIEKGLKMGGFDYITKPFSGVNLMKKINEVFERVEIRKRIKDNLSF
jgi:DNA-binding response OmpR family regulator